jgi:carbon starvation protein CstA
MNLRSWNKEHTLGLMLGTFAPLLAIPLVILILSSAQGYSFEILWTRFNISNQVMSKTVSLSIIINLILFYLLLNKEKYNYAMGIILGSLLYLPVILYLNFLA